MTKYLDIILSSKLFKNIKSLENINYSILKYKKGEHIFNTGDIIKNIYMVLDGSVHIYRMDYWGNRSIITAVSKGDIFAEVFASTENTPSSVSSMAAEESIIAAFNINPILSNSQIAHNLLYEISKKNIVLSEKVHYLSQRNIRNKLLSYFSSQAQKIGSNSFKIPFDRQELADFLSVDRSALSRELSNLKKEGVLDFNKNNIVLK